MILQKSLQDDMNTLSELLLSNLTIKTIYFEFRTIQTISVANREIDLLENFIQINEITYLIKCILNLCFLLKDIRSKSCS